MFNVRLGHLKCVCMSITRGGLVRPPFIIRFTSSNVKNEVVLPNEEKPHIPKPKLRFSDSSNQNRRIIGPFGWFLMLVPAVTFCLGTWQVRRKVWKEQLIAELHRRRDAQPRSLPPPSQPLDSGALSTLEYYPLHVRGHFLHELEMFVGPRTLLVRGDAATEGGLMSQQQQGSGDTRQGYLLVTPFQLQGRKERILVNRGWVPASYLKSRRRRPLPSSAANTTTTATEDVIGLIRVSERRPPFMPQQQQQQSKDKDTFIWMYRNIEEMALRAGDQCAHIYLDATDDHVAALQSAVTPVAPIANQTRVTLRNEHLSYVLTWYGLSAATATLWYRHFLIKR